MEEVKSGLLDRAEAGMRIAAAICLFGMALLTGADVLLRGIWNTPIFGCEEIVSILGIVVVGFALPYAHEQKSHIGVEIFVRRLPRGPRRAVKLVTDTATLALVAVIAWRMALYARTQSESGEVSMNLELPDYLIIYVLAFGFLVYALCVARDIVRFFKGRED
ncbi:MAG: TRAP transporter small permease [Pseudodesulfovibrio sp.]|uniref:Tripartite ATP-independent periplasmic transporter DctQ component n=1 Tax=Pseudodesulfovibrio aespoeensis (strain ATCC 700646 / DSM 10631 / Aspo-2) TaxID=643562 RepID=E6VYM8_PSEA9|nr:MULTISPECIES: TRAP transporter small permease [Pseudodesulfovibrio]MBU4192929.1 TRAP transporter small permease [Pseudomonadota bacterium]ADU63895.1 Tripartite ATP-independent periplasmic transporter DctQ component [Pseudodesulfovibrio aespoeensis Aspo-2]MBU4243574.1 TRAP transporter small permease [Pseudomonadota bacterium]MBU4378229.1 TRAP transporter small permease [Pseudomonadota bacterium]MBU4475438.1 TRAP transporter small permease [Pseudomonadota bacterium]